MNLQEVLTILSPAEARVFHLLLTQKTFDEIALELDVVPRTVHCHSTSVYKKLKVQSRIDLMSKFICLKNVDEGLVQTVSLILSELQQLKVAMQNVLPGGLAARDKNRV